MLDTQWISQRESVDRETLHVDNCYDFGPNISVEVKACRTNIASNTAFRGFEDP